MRRSGVLALGTGAPRRTIRERESGVEAIWEVAVGLRGPWWALAVGDGVQVIGKAW